ncbi:MAG: alpha/beta fold hydrolase [Beijerinckiaceae bacterium]|jgi:pimeloyl-ACP methyl ester carboxylesterase|nr:alpha/beta fold hydrolase [Beijerinckiaceae bacterium]MDO9439442.1 alpha/beta fold hydrolase [Beijerinckiaceae bacterium]
MAGRDIAFRRRPAVAGADPRPGIVWLGGFKSDMLSTKAQRLDDMAAAQGRACLRFDYSGHGESGGRFEDGTISLWLEESLALIRAETEGPQILVGSSMGGWIALLAARALGAQEAARRLAGLVLIAPAVDFTEALMWARMTPDIRRQIEQEGVWMRESAYSPDPYPVTRKLIEDGRRNLLLGDVIEAHACVHILQGMKDPDVPWSHAMTLVEHLAGDCVTLSLIKDGDHRLSREEDIARLLAAVDSLA